MTAAVEKCYQCGKCTAGCPVAARMDLVPNQLLRLVQLGHAGRAMRARAIWQCVGCQTCSARCPKGVDCAGALDWLRRQALAASAVAPEARRTVAFQKTFLNNIRRHGRLNELELVGAFKTATFLIDRQIPHLFKDSMLAPRMRARGKLKLTGAKVRDRQVVDRIFSRCMG
ncbi:MAG: 4Fe-4S dicluster domain-containing protein [Bryobacteraceae bacterium]